MSQGRSLVPMSRVGASGRNASAYFELDALQPWGGLRKRAVAVRLCSRAWKWKIAAGIAMQPNSCSEESLFPEPFALSEAGCVAYTLSNLVEVKFLVGRRSEKS